MSDLSIINQLAKQIATELAKPIPFDAVVWNAQECAAYLKKTPGTFNRSIAVLPSFPKAARIDKNSHPLYFAHEVVAWLESRKEKN